MSEKAKRPMVLKGFTYKFKVEKDTNLYITINPLTEKSEMPFEVFVNSYSIEDDTELKALTTMLSALFRVSKDITFIIEKLKKIKGPQGCWTYDEELQRSIYMHSIPYALGYCLEKFVNRKKKGKEVEGSSEGMVEQCPQCKQDTLLNEGGCRYCISPDCNFSKECS